jgi:hypothetical protein
MWCRAILATTLLATGCNGGTAMTGQPDLAMSQQGLTPQLLLSDSQGGLATGMVGNMFNFGVLRDLWVRVTMPSIGPVVTEHLTFFNPLGELMFETMLAFSLDPATQEMLMAGKSSPLTVYLATSIPGGYACDDGLPIAGTNFTRFPTTAVGDWHIKAEVDGIAPLETTMTVSFTR